LAYQRHSRLHETFRLLEAPVFSTKVTERFKINEAVTLLGLQKLEQILRIPTNHADGNLLRAQVTAAGAAIHAQVRVDETKMRQRQQGDVLERLLKVMAEEKKKRAAEENEEGAISLKDLRSSRDESKD
jgi:hypothetical protein